MLIKFNLVSLANLLIVLFYSLMVFHLLYFLILNIHLTFVGLKIIKVHTLVILIEKNINMDTKIYLIFLKFITKIKSVL